MNVLLSETNQKMSPKPVVCSRTSGTMNKVTFYCYSWRLPPFLVFLSVIKKQSPSIDSSPSNLVVKNPFIVGRNQSVTYYERSQSVKGLSLFLIKESNSTSVGDSFNTVCEYFHKIVFMFPASTCVIDFIYNIYVLFLFSGIPY